MSSYTAVARVGSPGPAVRPRTDALLRTVSATRLRHPIAAQHERSGPSSESEVESAASPRPPSDGAGHRRRLCGPRSGVEAGAELRERARQRHECPCTARADGQRGQRQGHCARERPAAARPSRPGRARPPLYDIQTSPAGPGLLAARFAAFLNQGTLSVKRQPAHLRDLAATVSAAGPTQLDPTWVPCGASQVRACHVARLEPPAPGPSVVMR